MSRFVLEFNNFFNIKKSIILRVYILSNSVAQHERVDFGLIIPDFDFDTINIKSCEPSPNPLSRGTQQNLIICTPSDKGNLLLQAYIYPVMGSKITMKFIVAFLKNDNSISYRPLSFEQDFDRSFFKMWSEFSLVSHGSNF